MSNERRHLRFLITSALLVGPALGCGTTEAETNTVAPDEIPNGNPVGPEPELEVAPSVGTGGPPIGNPVGPEPERIAEEQVVPPIGRVEPRPRVNNRPSHDERVPPVSPTAAQPAEAQHEIEETVRWLQGQAVEASTPTEPD